MASSDGAASDETNFEQLERRMVAAAATVQRRVEQIELREAKLTARLAQIRKARTLRGGGKGGGWPPKHEAEEVAAIELQLSRLEKELPTMSPTWSSQTPLATNSCLRPPLATPKIMALRVACRADTPVWRLTARRR